MPVIQIQGMKRLHGTIVIQGSKNGVLPVMAASLLHKGTTVLTNVPVIQDVFCMMGILNSLGCICTLADHCLVIDAAQAHPGPVPEDLARQMRSSIMLLGPMLGRFGTGQTSHPGGCLIGSRPIDLHLKGLKKLGAKIWEEGGVIQAEASGSAGLTGTQIHLTYPSVGATENIIMAAALAQGETVLLGAAREPEIEILCQFLRAAGAEIEGEGTSRIRICGGRTLNDTKFFIPGDRIVAGTYLGAVLCAGGQVFLSGAPSEHMTASIQIAAKMGAEISVRDGGFSAASKGRPKAADFATGPYPGFSTDLQSVMMAAAAAAEGTSRIQERIFENRFSTAKELQKLGAHIIINGETAIVEGTPFLKGAHVTARDLRGGAALVAAGLAAEGITLVEGYRHISRGYEDICRDLQAVGAEIELV